MKVPSASVEAELATSGLLFFRWVLCGEGGVSGIAMVTGETPETKGGFTFTKGSLPVPPWRHKLGSAGSTEKEEAEIKVIVSFASSRLRLCRRELIFC